MGEGQLIMWLAGICVTGFLFLAAWCWIMRDEISKRVTFDNLEKRLVRLEDPLNEIRDALCGDMKTGREGLLSKERRRDAECLIHKKLLPELK
jgi:hypothetical protein